MQKNDLRLILVQFNILKGKPAVNRQSIERLLDGKTSEADLILLPEMFNTGFTAQPHQVAESMQGDTVIWMQQLAAEKKAVVGGSLVVTDDAGFYNRFLVAYPSGAVTWYDKRHLFRMGGEHNAFNAGMEQKVIDINGWRCALFVCYDLRFPVWSRSINDYHLALYVANWPQARIEVWNTLLKARAIENQCYVAGVNRVGQDELGRYSGSSQVIDYKGNVKNTTVDDAEGLVEATLSMEGLISFRNDFPVWRDADHFKVNL